MRRSRVLQFAASAVALAVLTAGCTGGGADSEPTPPAGVRSAPGTGNLQQSYESVVRRVLTSVVQITTGEGLGSGIIYDQQGHIVTNAHVVGRAKTFQVRLATGGSPLPARLVAAFPPDDLAVIKLNDPPALNPAEFADSSRARVGEIVLAMGNPLGLSGSVTEGIISAVGRSVQEPPAEGSAGATITSMIQTSAAINPGNSGGALVDLSGRVIGIPTLAASDPQLGGGAAPGIGFAIPSNTATRIAGQIVKYGRVVNSGRAQLGITGATVTNTAGSPIGVSVVEVRAGSGAARAGIQRGDVITAINAVKTLTSAELSEVVAQHQPGQVVTVTFLRDQTRGSARVRLGQL